MRLFTALDLPSDLLLRMEEILKVLQPEAAIKWSPISNLHVTTKFIGNWQEDRLDELDAALQSVSAREAFDVKVGGLGWFPNERAARVFWAGVMGGVALTQLAGDTEEALFKVGVARDLNPYSPHLTLARIKGQPELQGLREKVEELKPAPVGEFMATGFHLYRSDPGSDSSIYRKIRSYSFPQ